MGQRVRARAQARVPVLSPWQPGMPHVPPPLPRNYNLLFRNSTIWDFPSAFHLHPVTYRLSHNPTPPPTPVPQPSGSDVMKNKPILPFVIVEVYCSLYVSFIAYILFDERFFGLINLIWISYIAGRFCLRGV